MGCLELFKKTRTRTGYDQRNFGEPKNFWPQRRTIYLEKQYTGVEVEAEAEADVFLLKVASTCSCCLVKHRASLTGGDTPKVNERQTHHNNQARYNTINCTGITTVYNIHK